MEMPVNALMSIDGGWIASSTAMLTLHSSNLYPTDKKFSSEIKFRLYFAYCMTNSLNFNSKIYINSTIVSCSSTK